MAILLGVVSGGRSLAPRRPASGYNVRMSIRHHAYDLLRWNTPLGRDRVPSLARSLGLAVGEEAPAGGAGRRVLDLGCGWAQLLIDLLLHGPQHTGLGVDADAALIERGLAAADAVGVTDRIELRVGDVTAVTEAADVVLAIGVSHAWGGTRPTLEALHRHVRPDGRLLLGDGGWVGPPTEAALAVIGEGVPGLDALEGMAEAAGWTVLDRQEAEQEEWDAFEEGWCAGLEAFAAATDSPADAAAARALAAEHRAGYREGYRGVLGFSYLVLAPR